MVKCRVESVLRALNLVESGCFTDPETLHIHCRHMHCTYNQGQAHKKENLGITAN